LLVLDDSTVPSLVVIEQFSLLTRNRLEACTEPTSDCEIGVTNDHDIDVVLVLPTGGTMVGTE
jgi:hypothetical protein